MMKFNLTKTSALGATLAVLLLAAGCNKDTASPAATGPVTLDTLEDQVTYIVGYNMAKQAQANGLDFNKSVMSAAIQDVLDDKEPRIAQAEQQQIMMSFQESQQGKREAEHVKAAGANLEKAQAFLAENATKEGVIVTESGLQYRVISSGDANAPSPSEDDTVQVHYHGTLIDGTVFDSSVDRGQPVSFPVRGVIEGWVEALQLMKVGDKFELFIPPELAYGAGGTSGKIGPNAALIFQVELLEINPNLDHHHGHAH